MVEKIISGGQTGADQGGLFAASFLGIQTGGVAPKGWKTEAGSAPWLADYGLVEAPQPGYHTRTSMNVKDCDLTVIFGDQTSPGSNLTVRYCIGWGRPYLVNPSPEELRAYCEENGVRVLNVAGNRQSKDPTIEDRVQDVIIKAFS